MDDDASIRWALSEALRSWGYESTEAAAAGVQMFLPKPYTAEKLLKALAQLLRGAKE